MKKTFIYIVLLFLSVVANAQTRNLSYYLEQAKINSPLINKSNNDNKIIKLDMQRIKNIFSKPIINVEASVLFAPIVSHDNGVNKFEWVSEGADSYTGYDQAFSDGGQYQAFVSLNQPLFTSSRYEAFSQKADVASQLNSNNILLTEHELEQLVSHQYILCLKADKQSEISSFLIEKLDEQLQTMQKLVDNAIYRQTDLMIMQIELENYRLEYQNFESEYQNNLSDLNLLCGINDSTLVGLKDVTYQLKPDTVGSSIFIKQYELDSLNILTNQTIFEQKYRPQVNLFANAGMQAIYLPSFNRFGFATGINFMWNIYDGHQKKIQQDRSRVEAETIEFEKQNFIKQNEINKNKYLTQLNSIEERIVIVQNQLVEYKKLVQLYSFELSQAQVSIMDFKNLIRDISAKKQEELLLQMQEQTLINAYNYWIF